MSNFDRFNLRLPAIREKRTPSFVSDRMIPRIAAAASSAPLPKCRSTRIILSRARLMWLWFDDPRPTRRIALDHDSSTPAVREAPQWNSYEPRRQRHSSCLRNSTSSASIRVDWARAVLLCSVAATIVTGMGLSNNALLIGALIDRESCRFVCFRIARIYDDNLFEQ